MKEIVAKSGEFELHYDFETQEYIIFDTAGLQVTPAEVTNAGYPKAPKGKWRWDMEVWGRILESKGGKKSNSKKASNNPATKNLNLCAICLRDPIHDTHFHTRQGDAGHVEVLCCPCAVKEGYQCGEPLKQDSA